MLFGGGFMRLIPIEPHACLRDDSLSSMPYGESDPNTNSVGSVSHNYIRGLSGDKGVTVLSLTGVTALHVSLSKTH